MRIRSIFTTLAAVLGVLALASGAAAQTVTGTLQGTVTDAGGGVLPGVVVTIKNVDTASTRDVTTNNAGFYTAPFLAIGTYTVTAKLTGFNTLVREKVQVGLNQTQIADFQLKPASVAETVTVVGASPPINTVNAEITGRLNEQQIADKPTLNPGSFLSLAEIFPGFQDNPTSGQNNPTLSSGSSINFNGTGTRGATFQIDGVNNDDSSENQHRQGAALSTIKEFQVISNNYTAEFGRGYGAVVLVQTKSGTNAWRGDLYEFMQDSNDLTALRKFALVKPDNQRHQYGGTVGFPIVRDRIFGFGSFDRTRLSGTQNFARDLFTPAELAAPRLTRGNDTPENRAWIDSILARYPAGAVANDPRSTRTYATLQGLNQPDRDFSGRLDWNLGQDTLTGRYQYTGQVRESDDVILGEQARQNNRQQNLGVTWTKVMKSNMVGEFRYGLGLRNTAVNIAAGNDTPIVRFTGSPVSSTILGNAGNLPIDRDQTDHQFVYNFSWFLGRDHSIKAGTDVRRQRLDDFADNFSRGFWTFNATCGGVTYATPYAAMLDGCVQSYQQAWGPFFLENRIGEANFYVEDNWRLMNGLNLNLGLRYEYASAPREAADRIDYVFHDDKDNVEPRLGAAWVLPASSGVMKWITGSERGDASLRGGYGIYHGRLFQSIFSQGGASLRSNPPNAILRTFNTQPGILNISDPTLGFVFVPGPQTARVSLTIPSENLEMPATQQWNLTYERKLPWESTLRVSYNGSHMTGKERYQNTNLPQSPLKGPVLVVDHPNNAPATGFPDLRGKTIDRIAADVACAGTGFFGITTNAACPVPVPIADNEISQRVPRTNERRPDPRYTTNIEIQSGGQTWYDGLQLEWTKRYNKGLAFSASYTRSRSDDTVSEATFVGAGDSNFTGPNSVFARGHSRFHTPHRVTFNGTWLMPFFSTREDLVGTLLGGWQLSTTIKLASGTPFTVTQTGVDLDFDGFAEGRPILLDKSILNTSVDDPTFTTADCTSTATPGCIQRSTQQLPLSAFRLTTIYDGYEDIVPRNAFYGDGTENVDLGLYKNFRIDRYNLSVRIETFNLFNTVQYGFPSLSVSTPATFGQLTALHSLYIPRTIQVALKFRY
jgi:Carboxypeptidase regulatory-like domain